MVYNGTEIRQYVKVRYLGCILDQSLSGESIALNVIDLSKFMTEVSTLTKSFLDTSLHRLLCNALIQPLFDHACTT